MLAVFVIWPLCENKLSLFQVHVIIVTEVADLIAEIIICIVMTELFGEYNEIRARSFDIAKVSASISGDSTKTSYWLLIFFAIAFIIFDVV